MSAEKKLIDAKARDITAVIVRDFRDGRYRPGDRLRFPNQWGQSFGVSGKTMKKALEPLRDNGFIAIGSGLAGSHVTEKVKQQAVLASLEKELATSKETPQTLANWVAAVIVAEIRSGALRPGRNLKSESGMADLLQVGRRPVHAGVSRLVDEGVLILLGQGPTARARVNPTLPPDEKLTALSEKLGPTDRKPHAESDRSKPGPKGGATANLERELRTSIRTGQLRQEELTTAEQLAIKMSKETGVSVGTARRAIRALVNSGDFYKDGSELRIADSAVEVFSNDSS